MPSESRNAAIAAIQINWKKMRPDLDVDESRDERLAWIADFLGFMGIHTLDSVTKLSDEQLGAVAGEMKRLTGASGQRSAVSGRQSGNVVRGEFGKNPVATAPGSDPDAEIVHLASPEMVYTLEKLEKYIGWSMDQRDAFLKKRYRCTSFRMLRYEQGHSCTNLLLHIAAHRDLKLRKGGKPVSRVEVAKYIPILKQELRIDQ